MSKDCLEKVQIASSWVILGPLLIALTALVTVQIYAQEALIFSLIAVLCITGYRWWGEKALQLGGAIVCLSALFLFGIASFDWISLHSLYFFGVASAFLLALIVTLLGFREISKVFLEATLMKPEIQPHLPLESLEQALNEKQQALATIQNEQENARLKLQQQCQLIEEQQSTCQQLKQELGIVKRDLTEKQHHVTQLQQQLQVIQIQQASMPKQQPSNSQDLERQLLELRKEENALNLVTTEQANQIQALEYDLYIKTEEWALLQHKQSALEEESISLKRLLAEQQVTHQLLEDVTKERDHLQMIIEQKSSLSALERELQRVKGLYQQLQQQFNEKDQTLQTTRQALFLAQEQQNTDRLTDQERELEEASVSIRLLAEAQETIHRQTEEIQALEALVKIVL